MLAPLDLYKDSHTSEAQYRHRTIASKQSETVVFEVWLVVDHSSHVIANMRVSPGIKNNGTTKSVFLILIDLKNRSMSALCLLTLPARFLVVIVVNRLICCIG